MQVGWVKIGDFRQITDYISKMVQDRHVVSIKVQQKVVCTPGMLGLGLGLALRPENCGLGLGHSSHGLGLDT